MEKLLTGDCKEHHNSTLSERQTGRQQTEHRQGEATWKPDDGRLEILTSNVFFLGFKVVVFTLELSGIILFIF